jgi:hypothetical protein
MFREIAPLHLFVDALLRFCRVCWRTPLSTAITVTLILAAIQPALLTVFPGLPGNTLFDDLGLLVCCVLALWSYIVDFRSKNAKPGIAFWLIVIWLVLVVLALVLSSVPFGEAFIQARQIAVPAMIIFVGTKCGFDEWRAARHIALILTTLCAVYMVLEVCGVPLIDPVPYAEAQGIFGKPPGYYQYYPGNGVVLRRAGGFLLNPPTTGLFTAAGFVVALHLLKWKVKSINVKWVLLPVLGLATLLSISRGGILILAICTILPFLIKRIGYRIASAIMLLGAIISGLVLVTHPGSRIHFDGLIKGVEDGVTSVIGRGFGHFGNFATGPKNGGESLAGLAFSALGIPAIVLFLIVGFVLWRKVSITPECWEASLGLSILLVALFAETASGLTGTLLPWLALGIAVQHTPAMTHLIAD